MQEEDDHDDEDGLAKFDNILINILYLIKIICLFTRSATSPQHQYPDGQRAVIIKRDRIRLPIQRAAAGEAAVIIFTISLE